MKNENIHIFTSCALNYLPKAELLFNSIRQYHPNWVINLALGDKYDNKNPINNPNIDNILIAENLNIPHFNQFAFRHRLVEFCTAIKPFALIKIFETTNADIVIYFDPDMVLFSECSELIKELDNSNIILTPHLTEPATLQRNIKDGEISSLKHGAYNLGFIGLKRSNETMKFLKWWAARLEKYCIDDIPNGLFTDQKWVDLAPSFFDGIKILRSPRFNVALWNIDNRTINKTNNNYLVNGAPLGFYHFSGFDKNVQHWMFNKNELPQNNAIVEILQWYSTEMVNRKYLPIEWGYDKYNNGQKIEQWHRDLYIKHSDLQQAFENPFQSNQLLKWINDTEINKNNNIQYKKRNLIIERLFYKSAYQNYSVFRNYFFYYMHKFHYWLKMHKMQNYIGNVLNKNIATKIDYVQYGNSFIENSKKCNIYKKQIIEKNELLQLNNYNSMVFQNIFPMKCGADLQIAKQTYPKISVIMRTIGNRNKILQQAIYSVQCQIYPNIEIILVENGGNSLKNWVGLNNDNCKFKIQYFSLPQKNRSTAGNVGLQGANGEFCIFLDDDDVFLPNHLLNLYNNLNNNMAVANLAYSMASHIQDDICYGERPPIIEPVFINNFIHKNLPNLHSVNLFPIQTLLFHKTLFLKYGGMNEELDAMEDWVLWFKYFSKHNISMVNNATSFYRVPSDAGEKQARINNHQKFQNLVNMEMQKIIIDNASDNLKQIR